VRDDPSVVALVTRAAGSDEGAWHELVERYAPLVWGICVRYQLGGADVEDVGQTVWLGLVEQLTSTSLREPAALPGWLATTTQRECLRVLRARGRYEVFGTDPDDGGPGWLVPSRARARTRARRACACHHGRPCRPNSRAASAARSTAVAGWPAASAQLAATSSSSARTAGWRCARASRPVCPLTTQWLGTACFPASGLFGRIVYQATRGPLRDSDTRRG
jgi:Sigma-70 region 2